MKKYVAQVKKVLKDIKVAESIFKGMYCKKYYLKIGFDCGRTRVFVICESCRGI